MHSNIEKLMDGDAFVPSYFEAAKVKWQGILVDITTVTVQDLADRLTNEQSWFETNCGGRWDGQEVMAVTGFASIYDCGVGYDRPGLGGNEAVKLATAFASSMVSLEVKHAAHQAALSYHIDFDSNTRTYSV